MSATTDVRPSPLAGRWYPADPQQLAQQVDRYLEQAEIPDISGQIIGVVTPHAGHQYSGPVAGYAFAALRDLDPEVVIILSPMHQPCAGSILTTGHHAYHTPLGDVPVDRGGIEFLSRELRKASGVELTPIQRDTEHAVEIELPFLQRVLPEGFKLIPLMIRDQDQRLMKALGEVLSASLDDPAGLLIASTDLSHFYPADTARALDQHMIDHILDLNPEGIYQAERDRKGFACGKGGLAAVLWAAKRLGANRAQHLKYAHSGEVTGDMSRVVGYEAALITRE